MIIVPVKEGENIEKALKKFKRKFEKTGVVKELRRRQQFDKPSLKLLEGLFDVLAFFYWYNNHLSFCFKILC